MCFVSYIKVAFLKDKNQQKTTHYEFILKIITPARNRKNIIDQS